MKMSKRHKYKDFEIQMSFIFEAIADGTDNFLSYS